MIVLIVGAVAGILFLASIGLFFSHTSVSTSRPLPISTVRPASRPASFLVTFQGDEVGSAPSSFLSALTGGGGPVTWVIVQDGGKTELAQTSTDPTSKRFPLCVYSGFVAKDVEVSTRFKPVSGKVDQAGGVIVRYQDKDNYYIVRANALENNVRLYKVIGGERTQIAGADANVSSGEWHGLALETKGSHFKVSYEGTLLFEVDDSAIGNAGQVGLWTKADSVTEFDMLTVNPE
jgi:hypothetical protein